MFTIDDYISSAFSSIPSLREFKIPWEIISSIPDIVSQCVEGVRNHSEFIVKADIARHIHARIEPGAIIKGPAFLHSHSFVAAHAYIRGGVFVDTHSIIGPSTEIKSSLVFSHSSIGHLTYVGDSVVGAHVDVEAGVVVANHFNERAEKNIYVCINGERHNTRLEKFGAFIGDFSCIGANAVLSPGTILSPKTIVSRLSLIHQCG